MRPFLRTLKALPPATFARLLLAVAVVILAVILIFDKNPWSSQLIPGRKIKLSHYVALYFWIAAAINLAAVFLLAATAGWWARPLGKSPAAPSRTATPRWFWPLVATAMLMTAAFSWPRLGQSVWHDEANRVKNTIAGEFRQSDDGTLDYHPVEWRSAFFDYRLPNHVGQSVLSKAFNDAWLAVARPAGLQFSETAIRLPGYLAGILGIAAIALLFREVGFPSAGVIAGKPVVT